VDKILADENYWDQNAFNDLMIRGAVFEPRRKDRLFMCGSLPSPALRSRSRLHAESRGCTLHSIPRVFPVYP
jgi:hypothetical protein